LIPAVVAAVAATEASAQLVYEPFDYGNNSAGNANLTNSIANGGNTAAFGRTNQGQGTFWTRTGTAGTDHNIDTTGGSLTGANLPDSIGNKATFTSTANVDRIGLGQMITAGRTYYSLLLKFDTLPAASSRIAGFNTFMADQPAAATVFGSALTSRSSGAGYQVGVAKNTATAQYDSRIWSTSDTLFVVGSYEIVGGVGSDDISYMWVNPDAADYGADFGAAPGPATNRLTDTAGADMHDAVGGGSAPTRNPLVSSFLLRSNAVASPWRIDEVRVDTTWAGVTPRRDLQYAWNAAGGGSFGDASKWNSNTGAPGPNPDALGAVANFGGGIASSSSTITTAGQTIDTINIDNPNALTIGGTGLSISSNASAGQLIARRGNHTISAPLTLSDDLAIKVGSDAVGGSLATLTLSGSVTGSGRAIGKYGLGTLKLGASNIIDDSATLAVRVGTLDLNGNNETVGNVILGTGHRNTGFDLVTVPNAAAGSIVGAGSISATNFQLENGSISAVIASATQVLKTTQGTARLSGASTYSGDTIIRAGTLLVGGNAPNGAPGALGNSTNAIQVSDSQTLAVPIDPGNPATTKQGDPVSLLTDAAVTIGRDVLVGPQGTPTLGGNSAHNSTFSGGITLNRATYLTAASGGNVRFSGNMTDGATAGSVLKIGAGNVTLSGTNSYTGTTTINAGALIADTPASLPGYNTAGRVIANSGGTLAVSAGGGGQWTTGDIDTAIANATLNGGSSFGINVDASNSFTYASNFAPAVGFAKLGGGTLFLTGSNNQSNTTVAGGVLEVSSEANLGPAPGGPSNNITLSNGGTLRFGASFDPSNNRTIVLSGGQGVIDTNGGNVSTGATIAGGGTLVKAGGGQLNIGGSNSYTGGTIIRGGTLSIFNDANLGGVTGGVTFDGGALKVFSSFPMTGRPISVTASGGSFNSNGFDVQAGTVNGAGTLSKDSGGELSVTYVRSGGLNVNGGSVKLAAVANPRDAASSNSGVSKIDSVNIGAAARLDLTNNKLITLTAPGAATNFIYNGLQGEVQRAYNFQSWDQPGLTTSQADATTGLTTIGITTGAARGGLGPTDTDLFAGQTITGASTLAMYTYAGDANLDGLIDGGDYGVIDNNVQIPGADSYYNGDFNYDGVIDGGDYGIIDNNIQAQGLPFAVSGSAGLSVVTAVPEPAVCGFAMLAAGVGLLTRRRRNA
jgi:autotransporter-associated beta strand protein